MKFEIGDIIRNDNDNKFDLRRWKVVGVKGDTYSFKYVQNDAGKKVEHHTSNSGYITSGGLMLVKSGLSRKCKKCLNDICKYLDELESFLFKIINRDRDGYGIKITKILSGMENYSAEDTSWFGNGIEYIEDSELVLKQKVKKCLNTKQVTK